MVVRNVKEYTELADFVQDHEDIWLSYDREADVVYISFDEPAEAEDSEQVEEDIVVRKKDDEVIGITLLNASRWMSDRA